jgi:outer membrane protein assembly factor BamB
MKRKVIMILWTSLAIASAGARAGEWSQFRGSNGSGVSEESRLPAAWDAKTDVRWKVEVPGFGWSSPVVWGDKIFVTTAVSDKQVKPKPGSFGFGGGMEGDVPRGGPGGRRFGPPGGKGGDGPGGFRGGFGPMGGGKPPDVLYRWEVYCLDRASGKVLWKQVAAEKKPTVPKQATNSYASETPVTDGERVYAYFGMTGLYCYDLAGKLLWSKDLGSHPMALGFGTGSSPTLDSERLYVQCDNEEKSFLAAFDKKTGTELWRVDRPEKSSYSTPFLWRNKQRTELVASGGQRIRSYDPASGKVLWELGGLSGAGGMGRQDGPGRQGGPGGRGGRGGMMGGMGAQCYATPVGDEALLYVGVGGFGPRPLFAVRAGAAGDLTLKEGESSNAGIAWSRTQAGPPMASPLLYKGCLCILEQRGGILSCYDAGSGKQLYKERLPQAKGFTSSPWAYDNKVFCLDEGGQTFVVQAGPEFKVLARNKLDEMFWSSPAVSGGALLLRGVDHLYCIEDK